MQHQLKVNGIVSDRTKEALSKEGITVTSHMEDTKMAKSTKKNGNGNGKVNGKVAKPKKEKKPSRIALMREAMAKGWLTAEELAEKTGVSKVTVSVQASYHLPKAGYKVEKRREDGRTLYHIASSPKK